MPDALTTIILGNVRAAGPGGCSLEWLVRRVNFGPLAIEKELGRLIMVGTMSEQNGVYKLQEVRP